MVSSRSLTQKEKIENYLRQRISNHEYATGERLPSVRALGAQFGVSVKIVSDALGTLAGERLVRCEAGRGVFVEQGKKLLFVFSDDNFAAPYHYFSPGLEECAQERHLQIERLPLAFIRANVSEGLARRFAEEYFGIVYDGFYMVGNEPEVSFFKATGLPVVMPHANTGDNETTPFLVMHPDFRKAFSDALGYLHQAGHRRIATLTFDRETYLRGYSQHEYFTYLGELGCDTDDALLVRVPYDSEAIDVGIRKLMGLRNPPTALLCISDFFAMYAMKSLLGQGHAIPGDISVMGFCGYPGGDSLPVPLSTVDLHFHEAGRTAVELVCSPDAWFGQSAARRVCITPHSIVQRSSVDKIAVS